MGDSLEVTRVQEGSSGWEEEDIFVSLLESSAYQDYTPLGSEIFLAATFRPLLIASSPTLSSTMPYNYAILCMQGIKCSRTQGSGLSSG